MSTARATCWSVTINNPSDSDEECINLARQRGWTVDGQKEVGKEGTPHYQLMVKTPQVRFSALKKAFPRANISAARNPTALAQYVHKDDTRVGELGSQSEFYPSLAKFWHLLLPRLKPLSTYGSSEVANPKRRLQQLDDAVRSLISDGYHIEGIAMNPSVRSSWNNFNESIMARCQLENETRALDRQTDTTEESVDLPINAPEVQASRSEGEEDDASCSEDSDSEEFSESEYQEV